MYISPEELALARARRRFFSAVFWAFIIYLVLGLVPFALVLLLVLGIPFIA